MSRLLRVELIRLLSRRAVLVLIALAVVLPALILVARAIDTQQPDAATLERAQTQAAKAAEKPSWQRGFQACLDNPQEWEVNPEVHDVQRECEERALPRPEDFGEWNELDLVDEREEGSGVAVAFVLAIVMMLAGTTFAGNDWASGSMSNQLLFQPRRFAVWAAKATVVTAWAGSVAALVVTAYWLALGRVAGSRGIPTGDGVLLDGLQSGWRGAGVAAAAALAGYALTMLFRSTVAALGVLLVVGLAGGLVLAVIGVDSVWNPGLNLQAVILDGVTYEGEVACTARDAPPGDVCLGQRTLSLGRALWFLGGGLAFFAAVSAASFQRRDIP